MCVVGGMKSLLTHIYEKIYLFHSDFVCFKKIMIPPPFPTLMNSPLTLRLNKYVFDLASHQASSQDSKACPCIEEKTSATGKRQPSQSGVMLAPNIPLYPPRVISSLYALALFGCEHTYILPNFN